MKFGLIPSVLSVLLTSGVLAATVPAAPVRGSPLPAGIHVKFQNFDGTGLREPAGAEEPVAKDLADRMALDSEALFDRTAGWQCLLVRRESPVVEVGIVVWTPDPAAAETARIWSLNVTVTVRGGKGSTALVGPKTALPRGADVGSMRFEANQQLNTLVTELQRAGHRPCEAKVKVRGRQSTTAGALGTVRYAWQGEGSLRLRRDGGFESHAPVKVQISAEVRGCTGTATVDSQVEITGSYREGGRLLFTRMWSPEVRVPMTVRCGAVSGTGQLPWGGDWLGGEDEVGVPLGDGVHVSRAGLFNPIFTPMADAEATLELEYGRTGSRPVAAAPRR